MLRRLLALLVLCLPIAAAAQDAADEAETSEPAVLIADRVSITPDGKLIAEGSVEAFQGRQKITARRITYDRQTEQLIIDGPIRLTDGPSITILADAAELGREMRDGLLQGARMVLDEQVQLSALQISRSEGRYNQLYKTVVTSCRICEEGEAPLWQIRARRVIHDQQERQLYFEEAQLRVGDVPIFYLPRLRLPDPTLERTRGFLIPSIRSTSQLSTGIKVPYFFTIGEHADLTLEPYLSTATTTLNFRYRQAFARGRIAFEGGVTRDDLQPGETRGYLFGAGAFALGRGYQLTFDIEWASDNAYLIDYGLPDLDRLDSEVALTRTSRDRFERVALIRYQSLRDGEIEDQLPTIVADIAYDRRFFPDRLGGEVRLNLSGHAHERASDLDVLGRDVNRITAEASWLNSWILSSGLRADAQFGLAADLFDINQDSGFPDTRSVLTPQAALTLRYPMTRSTGRATQFFEPLLQVGWSDVSGDALPNDESGRVEFDQGNLLSLSRFPAPDVREDGTQVAYGFNFARFGPDWRAWLTVGQIFRDRIQTDFTATSGLSGKVSDFLVAAQYRAEYGLELTARTVFNSSFDVAKAELRGGWVADWGDIGGTYIWLQEDAAEGRTSGVSEFNLDGSYKVNRFWTASAQWRYDLADTRAATAGLGLTYRNECVEVDLSLNRRYTSSTSVEPTTDFGFTIALRGFTASNGTERYVRSCQS